MKKHYSKLQTLALIISAGFLMSYVTGSPGGKTNAPNEGSCGEIGCHNVNAAQLDIISSDIPQEGYTPGATYTITVAPSVEGIDKYGFELAAYSESGTLLNGMTANAEVTVFSNNRRATHKSTSTAGIDGRSWSITWTAPSQGTGDVTFYVSSIAANGNGTNSGDNLYKDSYTVSESSTASVNLPSDVELSLYPNPASDYIHIGGWNIQTAKVLIFSAQGQLVLEADFTESIDIRSLQTGSYVLKLVSDNQFISRSFIKN